MTNDMTHAYSAFKKICNFLSDASMLGQSGLRVIDHTPDRIICTVSNFGAEYFDESGDGIIGFVEQVLDRQLRLHEYKYTITPAAHKDYEHNYCSIKISNYTIGFKQEKVDDNEKPYPVYKLWVVFDIDFNKYYRFLQMIKQ